MQMERMASNHRAMTIVQALEQYLSAREAALHNGAPIGPMQTAKGFLVIALEMLIDDVTNSEPRVSR